MELNEYAIKYEFMSMRIKLNLCPSLYDCAYVIARREINNRSSKRQIKNEINHLVMTKSHKKNFHFIFTLYHKLLKCMLLCSIMIILMNFKFFKYEIIFIQLSMITHLILDCIINLSISDI